jgi:CubicO group peptidase (beta-lactamase class C family)
VRYFSLLPRDLAKRSDRLLMWVHEAHRGQGIGKKLFEKSQQQGKSLRARFLWLGTPKYGGAVPFYEKLGPHARNEDNYQYKETVIVQFAWKLDPSSQQTWDPFGLGDNLPFIDRVPDLEDGIRNILQVTKIPEAAYWVLDRGNVDKGDISAVKPGLLSRVTKYQGTKVFAMGSITKPFFAYALHRAIKDNPGKIKASDLVSDHLNIDLSPYQTTIHQMLCHRNGLPGGNEMIIGPGDVLLAPNDEDSFLAMAQKAFNLAKVEFTRPDGSFEDRDEYSNLNYACLAILVEKKIGLSAPDLITKYVIEPFELRHTYVLTPEKRVPCYVVHTDGTQIRTEPLDHSGNAYTFAAMGMYSCREDLGKFLQQLLNEPLQIPVIFGRCNEERANHYYPIGLFRPLNKIAGSDWSLNRYKCPS